MEYDLLFKVLLLGDSGVGKSSLILRFSENMFNENLMNSIGVDFKLKTIDCDGKSWDTAGQERFRTITTSYYKGAQAIVIVYDITDKESFYHLKNWMVDIDRYAKETVLRFLVGNKCDLESKRAVTFDQGKELAKQYNIQFFETSAKSSANIDNLFSTCTKIFIENQKNLTMKREKSVNKSTVNLIDQNTIKTKKFGCC